MHKIDKIVFLERVMRERDRFELLMNRVGFMRRMTMKGVSGGRSIKDILAHILAREQFIADRMAEALHGEIYIPCRTRAGMDIFSGEFGYPDFDSPLLDESQAGNWVVEKYRSIPLDEIVAQEIEAFINITSAFERMPRPMLDKYNFIERVADHTYRHYRRHAMEVRLWLNSIAAKAK